MPEYDPIANELARGNARNILQPESRRLHADYKQQGRILSTLYSQNGKEVLGFAIPAGLDRRTFWFIFDLTSGSGAHVLRLQFMHQETVTYEQPFQWSASGSQMGALNQFNIAIRPQVSDVDFNGGQISQCPDLVNVFWPNGITDKTVSPHHVICSADYVRIIASDIKRTVGTAALWLAVRSQQLLNY